MESGAIIIAPGNAHLGLRHAGREVFCSLGNQATGSGCMPSADPMIGAVAEMFGSNGTAILFSGMGRDGLAGSLRRADKGGVILAQDEPSSTVWGMPRAVVEAGIASASMPAAALAAHVAADAGADRWG